MKDLLYRHFFSSWAGMTLGDWCSLLAEHQFRISFRYWPRAAFVTACASGQSVARRWEEARFRARWEAVSAQSPLFVLGHWRSGTTYLHQLLSLDRRFHSPTMAEVLFPHSILTGGPMSFFMAPFLPRDRGVDRVRLGVDEPFEDEFALAILSRVSPYLGWSFPSHDQVHESQLTLDDPHDLARWKEAFRTLVGKLALKHDKPILLKSPPHTARVGHLLDLFPEARFVHIHRHPKDVYLSTVKLLREGIDGLRLQTSDSSTISRRVIARYRRLYDAYLRERSLIPSGRLIEIGFKDLETRPIETLADVYARLDLPHFDEVRLVIQRLVSESVRYKKNRHPPLDPETAESIRQEWETIYQTWGYELDT
ncbi:sulfotransferase [bacterium]|nr:sulfotransferase [bacterium]